MLKVIIMILDIGIKLDPGFNFEKHTHPFLEHISDRMNLPDHLFRQASRSPDRSDRRDVRPATRNVNRTLKKLATGTVTVEIVETDIRKLQAVAGQDK